MNRNKVVFIVLLVISIVTCISYPLFAPSMIITGSFWIGIIYSIRYLQYTYIFVALAFMTIIFLGTFAVRENKIILPLISAVVYIFELTNYILSSSSSGISGDYFFVTLIDAVIVIIYAIYFYGVIQTKRKERNANKLSDIAIEEESK